MIPILDSVLIHRLREFASRRFGLHFDDSKSDFLDEVLRRRAEQSGSGDASRYLARLLGSPEWKDEERNLAEALTITESYFFRNLDQFRALVETVIPDRLRSKPVSRPLRILSAACSSGDEAYTLAILIAERFPELDAGQVSIRAIDINPAILAKAARGRYGTWSLRDTSPEIRKKYFQPAGNDFQLSQAIRSRVSFEERNLSVEDRNFWAPGSFDIIFCRNVLMYFEPEVMRAIVAREARALEPGGYLFLGPSDTLRDVSDDFDLCNTHNTFYYKRRPGTPAEPAVSAAPALTAPSPTAPVEGPAWMDAIARASGRIQKLTAEPPKGEPAPAPTPAARPEPVLSSDPLDRATELLRLERYDEALTIVQALPAAVAKSGPALLVKGILLLHAGRTDQAQAICREILAGDNLNPSAQYLSGLCLEQKGNALEALDSYRAAAYLDPEFAMPRYRLGVLLRRSGDKASARRHLEQALDLIPGETPSRLALFSSGFGDAGLLELCRSEFRLCGGRP